ncbi:biotin--[acetyl-CoA-carboxylase] ligase [Patescibacteria group bacterium]|nr:biotin--[acetyl-CoA-carboxylase] ligase [Patescibacteria group bacterium]
MNLEFKIKKFKKISSTNKKAKDLAKKGISPWTVILAEEQSTGYGQEKRKWLSPKGGLYFSIILPKSKIEDLQTLTILSAFVVAKIIKKKFSLEPLIKLPNDVLLNQKKVAGILTENIIGKDVKLSVMGIGLNTNIEKFPKDLQDIATSLKIELGKEVDNKEILGQIIKRIKEQLKTISE